MINFAAIEHFFSDSGIITYVVLIWLSFYFILSFAILFARMSALSVWMMRENGALKALLGGASLAETDSSFKKCLQDSSQLNIVRNNAEKSATKGLTWLSIIASTSPFIGLFGTVVSILETFGGLGTQNSLSIIAPKISEALVATACGILVAIPGYSFNLLIKRKASEIMSILDSQIRFLVRS